MKAFVEASIASMKASMEAMEASIDAMEASTEAFMSFHEKTSSAGDRRFSAKPSKRKLCEHIVQHGGKARAKRGLNLWYEEGGAICIHPSGRARRAVGPLGGTALGLNSKGGGTRH